MCPLTLFILPGFLCNFPRILNEPCRTSSDCCKFLQSSYEMHKYYAVTSPNQKKMDCSKGEHFFFWFCEFLTYGLFFQLDC